MSESRTRQEPNADKSLAASPHPEAADPLQESLDELVRLSDSLVDGLAMEEPEELAPPEPEEEPQLQVEVSTQEPEKEILSLWTEEPPDEQPDELSQQSRREAMRETLDALSKLIDDPSPPPTSAEVQFEGDHGEDIAACLENVLAPVGENIEAKPATSEIQEEETAEVEVAEAPGKNEPPVAPADPSEETEVETAVAIGADAAVESRTSTLAETPRRTTGLWWLLAIVVVIAALATTYWVMNSPSATPTPATTVEIPVPDPPVVFTKRSQIADPAKSRAPVEATVPAPAPTPAIELTPKPTPVAQPAAVSTPVVAQAHDTAPQVKESVPASDAPIPATIASRGKTTETDSSQPQTAGIAGLSLAAIIEPPEPTVPELVDDPPTEVGAPAGTPPVVLDRVEPVFDQRKLRRGEQQSVVLRVLVDERGRVVRVVVDESVAGSDAEFAAINAVLRWTYEPALEDGEPVRDWTTERFEFTRDD